METSIIVSGIAAGVSLVSVAANVYLARKSRRAELEVLRFKAHIARADAAAKYMKEVEVQGERLRIRGWDLLSQMQQWCHARGEDKPMAHKLAEEAVNAFLQQVDLWSESWANSKTEVSPAVVVFLQQMRHSCRHTISDVHTTCRAVLKDETATRLGARAEASITELLKDVEEFSLAIASFRRAILRGESEKDLLAYVDAAWPDSLKAVRINPPASEN